MSTLFANVSGNVARNSSLKFDKKLLITLSGSLKLTRSAILFTGLGL